MRWNVFVALFTVALALLQIGIDVLSYFDPDHGFLGFGDMLFAGTAAVALILGYPLLRGRNWARVLLVVILASFELLSRVQAVSPTLDRSYPNLITAEGDDQLNTSLGNSWRSLFSNTTGNFNTGPAGGALAPNDAYPTYNFNNSKFHGWWRNTMIGAMNGFNAGGPYSALQDQYIYIDASVDPVQIFTTYGTDKFPRLQPDVFDSRPIQLPPVSGVPTTNSYFYNGPNELVNGYNPPFEGRFDPTLSLINSDTLKLIDDRTISAFKYYNYHYSGQTTVAGLAIYTKMDQPPVDTSGLDWNNPVNLFNYYTSANTFSNLSTSQRTGGLNYVGRRAAEEITSQFLNGTFTKTTPLRKLRVTNTAYYAKIGIPSDTWTTIYTGDPQIDDGIFSYATPGSNVTIEGATGVLSILNGTYYNGVGLLNAGANLGLKTGFVDKGPHGSYNDLFYSFLLNLDTSTLQSLADPATGWIKLPSGITVTVSHSVSPASTYNEFCAACAAWFYAVFQTATHVERNIYTEPGSCRLVDTFDNLQTALKKGTGDQSFGDSVRYGQPCVNWYYHNFFDYRDIISGLGIEKTGGLQNMVNCPHPVNYYNPLFRYDAALGNYLVNIHNLVFTIRGVLEPDQPDPTDPVIGIGYPFIKDPSAGRAHFEGLVIPANVVNGVIQPNIPPNYASMGSYHDDALNLNAYYFGQINPTLTGGKIIGYLYKRDSRFVDPHVYMDNRGVYAPENPNTSTNPRIFRESLSTVYSKMMQWFNSIGCEAIIIDQVGNLGGEPDLLSIAEFMGANRQLYFTYNVFKEPQRQPLNYLRSDTVAQAAKHFQGSQYLDVSLNEKLYPGSVFKGTKVVLVTDIFSRSAGDIAPNYFIGEGERPGNLGNGNQASIVGCLDGREFSFISVSNSFPSNSKSASASKNLVDRPGKPVSPFTFNIDWGGYFLRYSEKQLSMLRQNREVTPVRTPYSGTSGSNALPISFEQTVFPDFGFTPMTRSFIPGWTILHPKPPTPSDPTTWTYLYLDAAILTAIN